MTTTDPVARATEGRPDGAALVQGDRTVTWAGLDARANMVARALLSRGVTEGDRVAVALRNSIEFFELLAGAGRVGTGRGDRRAGIIPPTGRGWPGSRLHTGRTSRGRCTGEGPYPDAGQTTVFAYGGAKTALEHLTMAVAQDMQPFGIGVNALMPSRPVATPGLFYQAGHLPDQIPMSSFTEAALRLLSAPSQEVTGRVEYSEDVLHPERGRRGWLGA